MGGVRGSFWMSSTSLAWPGFDLRPIKGGDGRVDYGLLPPRFFDQLVEVIRLLDERGEIVRIPRDE